MTRRFRHWWMVAMVMMALGAGSAWGQGAAPTFDLRWELLRAGAAPGGRGHRTEAQFLVTGASGQPLPAKGWSLYFTCVGEAQEGPSGRGTVVERVNGTLYRLRPAPGLALPAPGEPLALPIAHPGVMVLTDRAPQGPYLVFDADPARAVAPRSYQVLTPVQADRFDGRLPGPTAEEHFARNARGPAPASDALSPVFPTPKQWQRRAGVLRWTGMPAVVAPPALRAQGQLLQAWLAPFVAPAGGPRVASGPTVRLHVARLPGTTSPEAYRLTIDPTAGVNVTGATAAGVARGLQSLRSLLPVDANPAQGLELPALQVLDEPRFALRGLLLDVARHFHPKDTVLRVIDLMARYKLNTLHLHLTDDEGWRLAIAGLPELTAFGGRRGHVVEPAAHLPPAHGSGPDAHRSSGSGHFSADDYVAILRHAASRHVTVLPEIEMPGHARAAVQAMEARARRLAAAGDPQADAHRLADPGDRSRYRTAQLHHDNLMDPGLESTYRFVDQVVGEVARLHRVAGVPLKLIHLGADELPAGAWSGSPAGQAAIQRLGLAGLPGLWNHFYDRVATIARRHGARVAGWEELGSRRAAADGSGPLVPNEHFVKRDFTLFVWNNLDEADDLAYRLANAGYPVVLAPATRLYFDMAANGNPGEPGVDWAARIDLRDTFDHVPLDALRQRPTQAGSPAGKAVLTAASRSRVLGLEATLFGEVMPTRERLERLMLPRLFALAERAWAPSPAWAETADAAAADAAYQADWAGFVQQLGTRLIPSLQRDLPDVNFRVPTPGLRRAAGGGAEANVLWPGLVVRYTTDGREPSADSPAAGPLLPAGTLLKAAAFDRSGQRSLSTQLDLR